jgi:isocitrate dehydrogenase
VGLYNPNEKQFQPKTKFMNEQLNNKTSASNKPQSGGKGAYNIAVIEGDGIGPEVTKQATPYPMRRLKYV